ncbi:MAG: hypothetical protein AAFX99_09190 [Myxococcota bacterium]
MGQRVHHIALGALLAGVLLGVALSVGLSVWADGNPATDSVPRHFPYQGVLELDGQPVNASGREAIAVRFALYDGEDAAQPVYMQDAALEVYQGRFTTSLGPTGTNAAGMTIPVTEVIRNADHLFLGMTLLGDASIPDDDVELANRQELAVSPYAIWTTSATDLNVARDLLVQRNVQIQGDLSSNNLNARNSVSGNNFNASGAISGNSLNITGEVRSGSLNTGAANVSTLSATQQVTVGGPLLLGNNTYMRLPKRDTVPGTCNAERVGWVFFDTNLSNNNSFQLPCVCIQYERSGDYRWVPFDNWNARCN